MGRSVGAIGKNIEALVVVSKEIWLEVNADNTKYMVIYGDRNGGQCQRIMIGNKPFEMAEQFK